MIFGRKERRERKEKGVFTLCALCVLCGQNKKNLTKKRSKT